MMIKFKILSNKKLSRQSYGEKIYVGENKISWLYFVVGNKIGIYDTEKLNFELQVIFSDDRYMSFKIDFQPKTNKTLCEEYEGRLPITYDLTEKAQELKLIVRIADDKDNVIGITNPVSLNVEESESPTEEILPRADLDEKLKELQKELSEKQSEITDLLSKGELSEQTIAELNSEIDSIKSELATTQEAVEQLVDISYSQQKELEEKATTLSDFFKNGVEVLEYNGEETRDNMFYNLNARIGLLKMNNIRSASSSMVAHCSKLEKLEIRNLSDLHPPSNRTSSAISNNTSLVSINLPDVTTIGLDLQSMSILKNINIPKLENIDVRNAFDDIYSIQSIYFPRLKQFVATASYPFMGDSYALTAVILGRMDCTMGSGANAFTNSPVSNGYGYIYVPSQSVEDYKSATNWSLFGDQIAGFDDKGNIAVGEIHIPEYDGEVSKWDCVTVNGCEAETNPETGETRIISRGVFSDEYSSHVLIRALDEADYPIHSELLHIK